MINRSLRNRALGLTSEFLFSWLIYASECVHNDQFFTVKEFLFYHEGYDKIKIKTGKSVNQKYPYDIFRINDRVIRRLTN